MLLEPKNPKEEAQLMALAEVLTIPEIMVQWGKTQYPIMMAIYKGKLVARQAAEGKVWLVHRRSVIALWGEPKEGE